jgi:hypothetical protein
MTTFRDTRRGLVCRRLVSSSLLALLLFTMACSSSTGPDGPVTVLVVNETCHPGPCVPLRVFGFPALQPQTPEGFWGFELGYVSGAVACFRLPPSDELRVTNAGTGATTTYTWKLDEPMAFGALPMYSSMLMGQPGTDEFVPTRSEGWIVTLPSGTTVTPDVACTPPGGLD